MSGGKKGSRAGEFREFVEELWLIVLHWQKVVCLLLLREEAGGLLLGVQGIGCDESSAQIQISEKILEAGDLVGLGRDLDLPTDLSGLSIQATEKGDGLASDLGCGASAFAVDRQNGDVQILQMGTQPVVDHRVELVWVQTLERAADGGFAGGDELE